MLRRQVFVNPLGQTLQLQLHLLHPLPKTTSDDISLMCQQPFELSETVTSFVFRNLYLRM